MTEPIAIIGTGCRFPGGSNSPNKLWELLKNPVDLSAQIPPDRFNAARFYHHNPEHPGTTNVTKGYFLTEDPLTFDNEFFGISAREAGSMDPQQRILLETVYESLESAGYPISELRGSKTGVFVGQMSDDYRDLVTRDMDCHPQHAGTGFARSILANRVSYVYDWKGPSLNVDTACSSSLVALHLAVQSLRSGECDMAVVAGVNLVFGPEFFSFLSSLRMLSPNGRSRMWDANADGYARGEGFASVIIKPLSKALADGDDIESIIRNTGVNQDGRSAGLTVPSAEAQADLIQSTYAACGLDSRKTEDRCHYFECHGTGTQAGDPKEAEGIRMAFFHHGGQDDHIDQGGLIDLKTPTGGGKIQVGSIKTVVGHLEGTAGLASLLKASFAAQHGLIPPNLHFDQLNPKIEPFYRDHLEVPTILTPWPKLPEGVPRRASVNSFGFGGTNAHVIVESWSNPPAQSTASHPFPCWGPFVLSAHSETALSAMIVSLSTALKNQYGDIDLPRLAWTLQTRRRHFVYRASISAKDKDDLIMALESAIEGGRDSGFVKKAAKVDNPRILGIFTGQGAQWPTMGASLFLHSSTFRRTIHKLELALQRIPHGQGPTWSLTEELLRQADDPKQRLSSAKLSQPLCTALQVALVDLLRESGIQFSAVVGHSSGEIAAAYAAGIIGAEDAILIAYYRGYHSSKATFKFPKSGKMMAVGMAPDEAETFCQQPRFLGRICVAAKNSPSSVTLSGDAAAIDEAKEILDDQKIFARTLKVDTAYHSHHMDRVREGYLASLKEANIQPTRSSFRGTCNWYSSVPCHTKDNIDVPFEHTYWVENMTSPVLFSDAITSAIQSEDFHLALEIGPHPALRGPSIECIRAAHNATIPYYGVLERSKDALKTVASTLGSIWQSFDSSAPVVDFAGFWKASIGPEWTAPRVLKGVLPPYPWDHTRSMLKESRQSKAWRALSSSSHHELLGYPCSDPGKTTTREVRWRNILRLGELEWLQGHRFQSQVLLPASGHLAMAVEAALHLVGPQTPVELIELQDFIIHNGITLDDNPPGIEMNLAIRVVDDAPTTKTAEISCHCSNSDAGSAEFDKEVFTCRVVVQPRSSTGTGNDHGILPCRNTASLPMTDLTTDRFYSWMGKTGLQYSQPFLLDSIKKRLNMSTVTTTPGVTATTRGSYSAIHPGPLDSILQGLYAAFSYPGDGRVWTTYLPKSFRRVRFNMDACRQTESQHEITADCYVTESSAQIICGDIDAFCATGRGDGYDPIMQIEGIVLSAIEVPTPANDKRMFWKTVWKTDMHSVSDSHATGEPSTSSVNQKSLYNLCERTAYYYLKQLCSEVSREEIPSIREPQFRYFMSWALDHVLPSIHLSERSGWKADTLESITDLYDELSMALEDSGTLIDLKLLHQLGPKLPFLVRGDSSESALQLLKRENLLELLYSRGLGVPQTNEHLGHLLDNMAHQYPKLNVLEIGAGTGGSTSVALRHLDKSGAKYTYTFTDVSPSFFQAAQGKFSRYENFMRFQVLDIERPPIDQGFTPPHSYDLVIAAHVLHATRSVSDTLRHVRQLLRPGGYLILLEPTNPSTLRIPFLFGTLPGWWLGREDASRPREARNPGPTLTEAQWDVALRDTNGNTSRLFSGVDQVFRDFQDDEIHTLSVMLTQAVDERINILRDPLANLGITTREIVVDHLIIVGGGRTLSVSKIAAKMQYLLGVYAKSTPVFANLEDLVSATHTGDNILTAGGRRNIAVVCLADLEEATWAPNKMTEPRLSAMQSIFREARYVLWVTRGCKDAQDPYAAMMLGVARSVSRELSSHLRLKLVDLQHHSRSLQQDGIKTSTILSEMILQMVILDSGLPASDISNEEHGRMLWSDETEVVLDRNGALLIPRFVANEEQNNSFNSARRLITGPWKSLPKSQNESRTVQVSVLSGKDGRKFIFDETEVNAGDKSHLLKVASSSMFRFACSDGSDPFYLCLGYLGLEDSRERRQLVLTTSSRNASDISVAYDEPLSVCTNISEDRQAALLPALVRVIICQSLLEGLDSTTGGTVWIHDADNYIVEIIHKLANDKNITVFMTTTRDSSRSAGRTTYLHPKTSERQLRAVVPLNLRRFANMSTEKHFARSYLRGLGHTVDIVQQQMDDISIDHIIRLSCTRAGLFTMLNKYCSAPDFWYTSPPDEMEKTKDIVKVTTLLEQPHSRTTATITSTISWNIADVQSLQVRLKPPSANVRTLNLLSPEKTYFLVGLTGDVGLSLVEWMISRGARYIALSSRNPSPLPAHLCQHPTATIRTFACDVSDMDSLTRVHGQILSSGMPPISGVANGALVVRDHPFENMTLSDFNEVFGPKVIGSQNLDNLFFDTALDFFVCFSSVASIVGKTAQSAYSAANLFMASLAKRRRQRGLAASVMHFGMLVGFGFIHGQASSETVEERFRQDDLPAIPESEFHEIFAQAILSGRPELEGSEEVIAGLGTERDTPWRALARFGHVRVKDTLDTKNKGDNVGVRQGLDQGGQRGIQQDLKDSYDRQTALSVLKRNIAGRVSLSLGSSASGEVDEHVGLISLGLDSLVAVEIRSWLLKVLEVDVPVLKLLSGSSLGDICIYVLGQLPDILKPWDKEATMTPASLDSPHHHPVAEPQITNGKPGTDVNGANGTWTPSSSLEDSESNGSSITTVDQLSSRPSLAAFPGQSDKEQRQPNYERVGDMSHAQAQLYFLQDYFQNNPHNVAYSGHFHGPLDIARLREALWLVGKRHEAMRSAYFMDKGSSRPLQGVLSEPRIILDRKDINDDGQVQVEIDNVKGFTFDIEKGVVMKVTVLSKSPSLHFILFNHHHIALDGISWSIFISEVALAYSGRLTRESTTPASGLRQSIEMAKTQLSRYTPEKLRTSLAFWADTFQSIPGPLPRFPFAMRTPTKTTQTDYGINTADIKLPILFTELVDKAAAKIGVTSFHFYFASLATFLSRCLGGLEDIVIGVVDANRMGDEQDAKTVGYFLNMVPVRLRLGQRTEQFEEVAKKARDAILSALSHSHVPFDMILDHLGINSHGHLDTHPLFQVAINYRRAPLNETNFGTDGRLKWDGPVVPGGHPYHLLLNIASTPAWTFISFITQKSLYRASDGELLLKWYTRALEALVRDPSVEVARCPISNEVDVTYGIRIGRGPTLQVPWTGTLTERIDEVVTEFPDEISIKEEDEQGNLRTLTYAQMSARSADMTRILLSVVPSDSCSGSQQRAAMLLDPVSDAVCCILGIWRAGMVWIPLDTRNHPSRIRAIVEESQPQILVCHDATVEMARQICKDMDSVSIVNIDHASSLDVKHEPQVPRDRTSEPAMLIYTSGSTGAPKGVLLTHGGLTNQIYGTCATLQLGRDTITLQQSPLGFDLMLDQIFLPLCNGGTVVMAGKTHRGDPTRLAELMVRHGVTLTHFVPSEYLALLNYGGDILRNGAHAWRHAMSGGEKLGGNLRKAFRKLESSTLDLVNVYGPAEITLACARGIVPYRDPSTDSNDYLRASSNYNLEICDADMNILPVGFPGEICISGPGVGLGYLNRPEESMRKFVQGKYRSGDKGRLLPDGTLEVLGRMDAQDGQVKIHGFRVELDEIASSIVRASTGALVNAAVSLQKPLTGGGEDDAALSSGILVAFVVFDVGFATDTSEFLEKLRADLPVPHYMKPALIIPTERIPANPNGKTDRAALDKLAQSIVEDQADSNMATSVPQQKEERLSRMEERLKEAWEGVLSARIALISRLKHHMHNGGQQLQQQHTVLQPSTDFFQVGGNSMLMIQLKSVLEKEFGVTISMPELFHNSTLRSMATVVERNAATPAATSHQQLDASLNNMTSSSASSFLRPRAGGAESSINWDIEIARLAEGLVLKPGSTEHLTKGGGIGGLNVVLTGATGFIGRYLLSRLVRDDRVSKVHCLAIRPDLSTGQPRHVDIKSDKIVEYPGDLSQPNLGLSDGQFRNLTDFADVIIHNGADVSLLKTYTSLRQPNVVSTRILCEMAIQRGVPVHFVSTASVAKVIQPKHQHLSSEFVPLLQVPAAPAPNASHLDTIDGYALSKWASETLLEKVFSSSQGSGGGSVKTKAYVHRLAHVTGDDSSELDAIGMLLKYSLLLGALPRISVENVVGQWDFVHVDEVVGDLVELAISSGMKISGPETEGDFRADPQCLNDDGQGGVVFIHHCNEVKIPHERLSGYLEGVLESQSHAAGGIERVHVIREIPMREWLGLARERGLHPLVHEFYAAFDEEAPGDEVEGDSASAEVEGPCFGVGGDSIKGKSKMVLPLILKG